jgi:hypothetical protein
MDAYESILLLAGRRMVSSYGYHVREERVLEQRILI